MTTSQPPDSAGSGTGPVPPADQGGGPTGPSVVRPAVLAGSVLALLTYLCGFFGAYELSFSMMLVLAGGLLAMIGLLPNVGRMLVPSALLASLGFFFLLLQATSTSSVQTSGVVRWVALALAMFSAAALVIALMFDVGVLTPPAPRPVRAPTPPHQQQAGWNPYGRPGYGAPGAPGQPGGFDPAQPGYGGQPGYGSGGYGTPGQQGYGSPGHGAQPPAYGAPAYGATPSATGGYGAVGAGAGGYGGAQGYGAQGYGSQGYGSPGTPGPSGYGPPAYGASNQPPAYGSPSQPGGGSPIGAGQHAPAPTAGSPSAFGSPSTPPGTSAAAAQPAQSAPQGGDGSAGPASGSGGSAAHPAPTATPGGNGTPEATTPGVPASGGDTLADDDNVGDHTVNGAHDGDRTHSFRPADGSSGSGS